MKKKPIRKNLSSLILYAIALAMGVAATVLSFLGAETQAMATFLGIAVFCLAVAGLDSVT